MMVACPHHHGSCFRGTHLHRGSFNSGARPSRYAPTPARRLSIPHVHTTPVITPHFTNQWDVRLYGISVTGSWGRYLSTHPSRYPITHIRIISSDHVPALHNAHIPNNPPPCHSFV